MIVLCPKCKTKLKVADEKIAAGGSRFKCPRCSTILLVKKPAPPAEKPVDKIKILVAHSNPAIATGIISLLNENGYRTVTASDGIEAMVMAIKELPFLAVVEVGLPKIYGFEVCKRLKLRPETKGMKFVLVSSPYDKDRYKREPESFYGADDYIEEHSISDHLVESINALKGKEPGERGEKTTETPVPSAKEELRVEPEKGPRREEETARAATDEKIERARRLARTIVSDIYLYNMAKADESIRNDTFSTVFAAEIREGLKLYENRIAQEVRAQADFFKEVLNDFVRDKKKAL